MDTDLFINTVPSKKKLNYILEVFNNLYTYNILINTSNPHFINELTYAFLNINPTLSNRTFIYEDNTIYFSPTNTNQFIKLKTVNGSYYLKVNRFNLLNTINKNTIYNYTLLITSLSLLNIMIHKDIKYYRYVRLYALYKIIFTKTCYPSTYYYTVLTNKLKNKIYELASLFAV